MPLTRTRSHALQRDRWLLTFSCSRHTIVSVVAVVSIVDRQHVTIFSACCFLFISGVQKVNIYCVKILPAINWMWNLFYEHMFESSPAGDRQPWAIALIQIYMQFIVSSISAHSIHHIWCIRTPSRLLERAVKFVCVFSSSLFAISIYKHCSVEFELCSSLIFIWHMQRIHRVHLYSQGSTDSSVNIKGKNGKILLIC